MNINYEFDFKYLHNIYIPDSAFIRMRYTYTVHPGMFCIKPEIMLPYTFNELLKLDCNIQLRAIIYIMIYKPQIK